MSLAKVLPLLLFLIVVLGCAAMDPVPSPKVVSAPPPPAKAADAAGGPLRDSEKAYAAGDVQRARALALDAAERFSDARGFDLLARYSILEGDFQAACDHAKAAIDRTPTGHPARGLRDDVFMLARGFRAYESGDLGAAETSWKDIKDPGLKASLKDARQAICQKED